MSKSFGRPPRGDVPNRTAFWLVLVLSGLGMGVAYYLFTLHTAIAGNPRRGLCTFTDTISCDAVLASPYAEIAGVPVALIGMAGFAGLFGLAAICLFMPQWGPCKLRAALVLVAAFGLCFELAMTGVEVFIIQAVCPYCLTALGLIAGTFLAALWAWRGGKSPVLRPEADHA
jgi:uncharacterized membrane protein